MITGISYARYSSTNQRDESIEAQLDDIYKYAEKNEICIIKDYIDEAESAKTDDRENFQLMMSDVKNKIVTPQVLLLHKVDRFARNRTDAAFHKMALKKAGIKIIYVSQNIPDSPEGKLMEGMLESFAEYYSENLAFEVMKGLKINAKRCLHNGGIPPLGYDVVDKKLVVNEHEARAIKRIFQMYIEGHSYGSIIKWLNQNNYKTKFGKPFGKNSIYSILGNEKYKGTYVFNRAAGGKNANRHKNKSNDEIIRVPEGIPSIIDNQVWMEAKERMESKKFKNGINKTINNYLLTGLIYCGECGSAMGGNTRKGRNGQVYSDYQCIAKRQKKTCTAKGISCEFVEKEVISQLQTQVFTHEKIEEIANKMQEYFLMGVSDNERDITYTEMHIAGIDRKIRNILDAIAEGFRTPQMKLELEDLDRQKTFSMEKLRSLKNKLNSRGADREQIIKYLNQYAGISKFSFEEKKKAVQTFIEKVTVLPDSVRLFTVVNTTGRGERT